MVLKAAKKFNEELRKNMHTAVIAAFSLVIAFAWRDVITEYVNDLTSVAPIHSKLISAILVTIIAVIGIVLVSFIFAKKEDNK
ncbi:hypothetical protein GF378_00955 [Candidatus Pacearchaeota archaeon]|nr:hypothetical protein [Candidatus Pacearchaeota archaeon]